MNLYHQLLADDRWKARRLEILKRDKYTCKGCSNSVYAKDFSKSKLISMPSHDWYPNTHVVNFNFDGKEYNVCLTVPYDFEDILLGQDVYFDLSIGKNFGIKAIKCDDGWAYAYNLHVHHTYYQDECKPWEYPDTAFETLCWNCHEQLHKNQTIPWLRADGSIRGVLRVCSRCCGAGIFPEYHYVENGVCFECRGARYLELIN